MTGFISDLIDFVAVSVKGRKKKKKRMKSLLRSWNTPYRVPCQLEREKVSKGVCVPFLLLSRFTKL